ncbi:hypothetical protein G210_3433 [Candida maltosa Xu316]|uniref:Uncharacterized protein n=1 Tax=Candida maltosa (strain Xu316) TaxID=1245528 RepID=M3JVA6_CANMX|nr:hypothetical protein G210_3433 [Candida maltosa Xu316]
MGVTGLLQCLKEIQDPGTLERYRGKTLAIDTYGWLHRALVSCAEELCLGKPTRNYITYVLNKISMLKHFGITPYFVFDGASLPTKRETNNERHQKRKEAKELAEKYIANNNRHLAYKQFMKAAYVTSQMAKSIMCELDSLGIQYVVAPYEADPQMVYLEKIGLVDGILSEDSDLLIFGCTRLITKLKDDSSCVEINKDNFGQVKQIPYLSQYTPDQLRLVAMLSGCDYTKGIPGIGLKTAFQMVRKYNNLDKLLIALRSAGKTVPATFHDEVQLADLAFQFQKVFDPRTQELTTLNEYPAGVEFDQEILESCCGRSLTNETYRNLCNGFIHPNTHEVLVSREQSLRLLQSKSVYSPNSRQYKVRQSSFTKAQRSHSEGTITAAPGKSVLDLLKVSKKTITTTKVEVSENPTTPEKEIKRASVVYGKREIKLSPTNRKLRKLNSNSPFSNGMMSKFFKPKPSNKPMVILPTPKSSEPIVTPGWDSSLINDSEITDDDTKSSQKVVDTQNVLDELTDNDDEEEEKQVASKDEVIHSSPNKAERFDIYSNDDEIEESPIKDKPSPELVSRLHSLKETFSFQSTKQVRVFRTASFTKPSTSEPLKRTPLQSKNVNLPAARSKSIKLVDASPVRMGGFPSSQESPTKSKRTIDIRQFAYRK